MWSRRLPNQANAFPVVGPIIKVTPFDQWGRRILTMNTTSGRLDIIQGITQITPTYAKVEGLHGRFPLSSGI